MERLVEHARALGEIQNGSYRVVVLEESGRISVREIGDLRTAQSYADDAASESGEITPLAIVVNERFDVVYCGKPYYLP